MKLEEIKMASPFRRQRFACCLMAIILTTFWSPLLAQDQGGNNQGGDGNDQGEDESSGWDEDCQRICPENEDCVNTGLNGGTENYQCQCRVGFSRNAAGTCLIDRCSNPPQSSNVLVTGSTYTYGSSVTYSCAEGYMKTSGSMTNLCMSGGIWSQPSITCSVTNCGTPEEGDNSQVSYTTATYQSTATYQCNTGYVKFAGSENVHCQGDGSWSDNPLYCVPENGCEQNDPCKNGGVCEYDINKRQKSCKCLAMQKGSYCEKLDSAPRKFDGSVTIINVPYKKEFNDPNSPEWKQLAANITHDLSRSLYKGFPTVFQGLKIKSFRQTPEGFLDVDFDINMLPQWQGNANVLRDQILQYLIEGKFLDPYFDRQYQLLPQETDFKEPRFSPNKMTPLFVVMAMTIPAIVTMCCFLAVWWRRRTRRRMREEFEDDETTTQSAATSYVIASRPVFMWMQRPTAHMYLPNFADEQSVHSNSEVRDFNWTPPRPASVHRPKRNNAQFSWREAS